jgi:hypothetical protein
LTKVLVKQHPDQQGQRVPAQQRVGGVVPAEVEGRHPRDPSASASLGKMRWCTLVSWSVQRL